MYALLGYEEEKPRFEILRVITAPRIDLAGRSTVCRDFPSHS
jgi:hypothetical protein